MNKNQMQPTAQHRPNNTPHRCQLRARAQAGLTALALGALLGGCGLTGLQPAAPLQTYRLDGDAPRAMAAAPLPGLVGKPIATPQAAVRPVLLVEMPHAAAGYDSTRMVYVRQPLTQEAFANSAWADTPARMLAPLLASHLQGSGQFRAVLLAPSAAKAGLRLESTILRLQQDFLQQPSVVRLRLQLTLVDNSTRQALAMHTVDVTRASSTEDAAGGAAAARAALQEGLQQVAAFLRTAVPATPALAPD